MNDLDVDVSILIVSFNTRDMTLECLGSIFEQTKSHSVEVIVIDNDSQDGSCEAITEHYPDVQLIRSEENLGFARANNVAAERARGRRTLLLNPDTVILDGAIDTLLDFADAHPDNRLWGGRHVFRDGSKNPYNCWADYTVWTVFCGSAGLTRTFATSAIFNQRSYPKYDRMSVKEVDIITGCFLLIDTDLWNQLGGFDEDFFLFAEEADFCVRARKLGARPLITPESVIIHDGGGSATIQSEDRRVHLIRAERQYHRKHLGPIGSRVACFLVELRVIRLVLLSTVVHLIKRTERPKASFNLLRRRKEWA